MTPLGKRLHCGLRAGSAPAPTGLAWRARHRPPGAWGPASWAEVVHASLAVQSVTYASFSLRVFLSAFGEEATPAAQC